MGFRLKFVIAAAASLLALPGATTAFATPPASTRIPRSRRETPTRLQKCGHASMPRRTSSTRTMAPDPNNAAGGGGANEMDPGLKLLICVLIDFVGVASFAAPGVGEAADVGWAPISALLVNYLFGNGVFTALALVEELSPGFDFIPTATIAWFLENAGREEAAADSGPPPPPPSASGAGRGGPSAPARDGRRSEAPRTSDAIDAEIVE